MGRGLRLWAMQPFHSDRYSYISPLRSVALISLIEKENAYGYFRYVERPRHGQDSTILRFVAQRNINYRNSFLPVIIGRIEGASSGSRVELAFRMHRAVQVFTALWLIAPSLLTIAMLVALMRGAGLFWWGPWNLIPPAMVLFMIFLIGTSYRSEREKALDFLRERLELTPAT
jgi:hypothetical protein